MSFSALRLFTDQLLEQKRFYTQTLSFPLLEEDQSSFSVQIGKTRLQFVQHIEAKPIHFAINIPSFKIEIALRWLQERVDILPFAGKAVADFSSWNAEAVYFHDPGRNIVEFIARRNLALPGRVPFDFSQCYSISEVGIGTNDIEHIYQQLHAAAELPIYDGNFDRFCAIGDEEGLFIVVDYAKKKWFPTDEPIYASAFEVKLRRGAQEWTIVYDSEQLTIN